MTKGAPADQERAIARAVELGINYIDTASIYGDGESERNLGRVLKALKPKIVLGTKVRLVAADRGRVARLSSASSKPAWGVSGSITSISINCTILCRRRMPATGCRSTSL